MLTEINTPTGQIEIGDQVISLRGLNLIDIQKIQTLKPELFEEVAQAIDGSDGTEYGTLKTLIKKFGELASMAVAAAAGCDDLVEAGKGIRKWPLGGFAAAVMEVYRLTTLGNEAAKKSLKTMLPEGVKGVVETH